MGANLRIANTAILVLIGLQLMVPSQVGAVENSTLSKIVSRLEQQEDSDGYTPPDNGAPAKTHPAGTR